MYRDMVLVRRFDTEAVALQRQGELGLWASLLGQEASQVGSGRALSDRDMAFPSYREHGVAWCRGVEPERLLALYRGVTHGGWDPEEHKFHLYTIVIGNQTLHATGYAMGIQRDGAEDEAVITYFGDGATSQGDVSEAFSSARTTSSPSPRRRSGRAASRSTSGPAASASPASGWTATTCLPATRSPSTRCAPPARVRARR
jgi:pyruvate dehydrogenase E1 component alpha subunit